MRATVDANRIPTTRPFFSARLLNMLVSPGEVFDGALNEPVRPMNWFVPAMLVALTTVPMLATTQGLTSGSFASFVFAALETCVGLFWAALVLWLIGRVCLKVRFSFWKSLEIVGLTGVILALGNIVTGLLMAASGDVAARPALSFFLRATDSADRFRAVLGTINVFYLWVTVVLVIGLAKLSRVSFREAAFWVSEYWLFAKIALLVLA